MKKSLVVLLIAVLALSAVFAADVAITATGEVEASYVFDFDAKTGTYNVPELEGELAWEVVLPLAKAGSQYPYINVAGEIDVDFTDDEYAPFFNEEGYLDITPEVDFDTFEIVGEDWKIDFLADITSLDYAVSAIDTTWYAPKSKTYNVTTGRNVEANLTYRWLTDAEYVVDAVSFTKDGVGTITVSGSNSNGEQDIKDETTTYELLRSGDKKITLSDTTDGVVTYKNGVKTRVKYYSANYDMKLSDNVYFRTAVDMLDKANDVLKNKSEYSYSDIIKAYDLYNEAMALIDSVNASDLKDSDICEVDANTYYVKQVKTYGTFAYKSYSFAITAETDEIKLSDSITTQFGAGFAKLYSDTTDPNVTYKEPELDSMKFGFSAKAAYEDILSVAYDFGYDFDEDLTADEAYSFDVATSFKYDAVAVDVYLAHGQLSYYNAADLYKLSCYQYYTKDAAYEDILLSAKASVNVEELGTKFTFVGKNLLGKDEDEKYVGELSFEAVNTYFDNYEFTFDAATRLQKDVTFSFKAEADYSEELGVTAYAGVLVGGKNLTSDDLKPVFESGVAYSKNGLNLSVDFISDVFADVTSGYYDPDEDGYEKYGFTVAAGYEAEMFEINSAVYYNTHETAAYKSSAWTLDEGLYVEAGISTDKLVDGATLSLEYESGEILEGDASEVQFGTLTAACTVEF